MTPSLRRVKGKQLSSISLLPGQTPLDLDSYEVIEGGSGKQLANKDYVDNLSFTLQDVVEQGNTTTEDIVVTDSTRGVVLTSPIGENWRININNNGQLLAEDIIVNGGLTSGDIVITDPNKGLILKAPDGDSWRVTISEDGRLIATEL